MSFALTVIAISYIAFFLLTALNSAYQVRTKNAALGRKKYFVEFPTLSLGAVAVCISWLVYFFMIGN